jgi:PilZ domain
MKPSRKGPGASFAGAMADEITEKRRTDRVNVAMPLEIFGTDLSGKDFADKGRTKTLSRFGAAIVFQRPQGPDDVLTIRRAGSKNEAKVRVVGQIGIEPDGNVYGVAITEPALSQDFWGVYFPPLKEAEDSLVRVLLECSGCHGREVAPLNEIEFTVFEANDRIQRQCGKCRQQTYWRQSFFDASTEQQPSAVVRPEARPTGPDLLMVELEVPPDKAVAVQLPVVRDENRRRNKRVRVTLKGCILLTKPEEEDQIDVLDMSRTGIRFRSPRKYIDNMWVQVAVPYTRGAGNIFQPGRIAWRRTLDNNSFEYGLKYVKS